MALTKDKSQRILNEVREELHQRLDNAQDPCGNFLEKCDYSMEHGQRGVQHGEADIGEGLRKGRECSSDRCGHCRESELDYLHLHLRAYILQSKTEHHSTRIVTSTHSIPQRKQIFIIIDKLTNTRG